MRNQNKLVVKKRLVIIYSNIANSQLDQELQLLLI